MCRTALILGVLAGVAAAPLVATGARPPTPDPVPAAAISTPDPSIADAQRTQSSTDATAASSSTANTEVAHTADSATGDRLPAFTSRSARLDDVARSPVAVRIDPLGIAAAVSPAGVTDDGQLEVPAAANAVVWYEAGSVPGAAGSAVLAGHVDHNGRRGVFFELGTLRRGDTITVELDDGEGYTFEVRHVERHAKRALPTDELFTRNGSPVLTLITCGGRFDRSTGHYADNVVVRAALVGDTPAER